MGKQIYEGVWDSLYIDLLMYVTYGLGLARMTYMLVVVFMFLIHRNRSGLAWSVSRQGRITQW